jgi:hypothetical protein
MSPDLRPRAPQGPSDAELNAIPPDPILPRFGGNTLAANIINLGMGQIAMVGNLPDRSRVVLASRLERS